MIAWLRVSRAQSGGRPRGELGRGRAEKDRSQVRKETTQKIGRRCEDLDGSRKTNGKSGCGVVMKGVDTDQWMTISEIAVPLTTCTTIAPVIVGASVLTGILDLMLGKSVWKTLTSALTKS